MHIPGKIIRRSYRKLARNLRFFREWAGQRFHAGKDTLLHVDSLMALPNAQQVAQIAGEARHFAAWQDSAEQGKEAAAQRWIDRNKGNRRSRHIKTRK